MATETLPQLVPKLWGHEEHLVLQPRYTLKRLVVQPGFMCSLHYHRLKHETFLVVSGRLQLDTVSLSLEQELYEHTQVWQALLDQGINPLQTILLGLQEQITLPAGVAHRFRACGAEPCIFLEVSTRDRATDSYRLELSRALLDTDRVYL